MGEFSVSFSFPTIDQIVSGVGMSMFLSELTKPLSIKYPSLIVLGPNKVTFFIPLQFNIVFFKS